MILPYDSIENESWNFRGPKAKVPTSKSQTKISHLDVRLKEAIQAGEICYYLQPIFDIPRQQLIAAEALIRWQTDGEIHLPSNGYLDRLKLIETRSPFFEIMADKRKSLRSMISLHCDIDLHFNLNSEFFQYPEKGYGLSQICGENPCFFDLSVIEITEETLSQKNEKELVTFLQGAKEAGCKIALDDFGSEHSNLKRFMDYDIDIIKLDKSLTRQLIEKSKARAVLRNLALMCDDLGVQIYAEGVECQDTSDALLEIGISIHQGFLHGKAIPVADFARKVDEFQKGLWMIH